MTCIYFWLGLCTRKTREGSETSEEVPVAELENTWSIAKVEYYAYKSRGKAIMTLVKVLLVCRGMRGKRHEAR